MTTKSSIIYNAIAATHMANELSNIDFFTNPKSVSKTRSKGVKAENDNKRLKRKQARLARRHNR